MLPNLGVFFLPLGWFVCFNLKLPFSTDFDYWDYVVPEPNLNEVVFEETTCQSLVKMLENLGRTLIKAERLLFPVVLPSSVASKLHAIKLIRKVRRLKLWF